MTGLFRLALVTGASSGIGRALCSLLANQGISLLITGRDAERLEEVASKCRQKVSVQLYPLDLSIAEQMQKLIAEVRSQAPDLVINNAGFGLYGSVLDHDTLAQVGILEINGAVPLELSIEAAKALIARESKSDSGKATRGVIVNLASAAACVPFPGFAVYAAAKAFIYSFSVALDEELREKGVRVLVSCPGAVETGFQDRASGGVPRKASGIMTAEYAAEQIWKQVVKEKKVHVFDWRYKLGWWATRYLLPQRLVWKLVQRSIKKRLRK